MADLEERYGFRSAWNLPLDQYPIDWSRDRTAARARVRIRRARSQARRTAVPQPTGFSRAGAAAGEARRRARLARIPRAVDPAARGVDSASGVRLRQQLFRHRYFRAATRRHLQHLSILSRFGNRAALHAAAGSHADSSAGPRVGADLDSQGAMDRLFGRDDPDLDASRLQRRGACTSRLTKNSWTIWRRSQARGARCPRRWRNGGGSALPHNSIL